jgi:hypothetical protein
MLSHSVKAARSAAAVVRAAFNKESCLAVSISTLRPVNRMPAPIGFFFCEFDAATLMTILRSWPGHAPPAN